jgi:hypothetical protein
LGTIFGLGLGTIASITLGQKWRIPSDFSDCERWIRTRGPTSNGRAPGGYLGNHERLDLNLSGFAYRVGAADGPTAEPFAGGGTGGSNPVSSSGESVANLTSTATASPGRQTTWSSRRRLQGKLNCRD